MIDPHSIKSADKHKESPEQEQEICLTCGMCCDGTLFDHAKVEPGEKDLLPDEIRKNYFRDGENEKFKLPCSYFSNRCTIYSHHRASTCWKFRCELLKKFSERKITITDAFKIIQSAHALRSEIFSGYRQLFKEDSNLYFRRVFEILETYRAGETDTDSCEKSVELLISKCIIFDVLLTRHFKLEKYFQQMIEKNQN
jgi:hypothetical protein